MAKRNKTNLDLMNPFNNLKLKGPIANLILKRQLTERAGIT